jgi:hypothetical protein
MEPSKTEVIRTWTKQEDALTCKVCGCNTDYLINGRCEHCDKEV